MRDIALDPLTHDLAIPMAEVTEDDALRQSLLIRLGFFKGEWFLDTDAGVPYFQELFANKQRKRQAAADAILKDAILSTPGVRRLLAYSSELGADRELLVEFTVLSEFGEVEVEWQDLL